LLVGGITFGLGPNTALLFAWARCGTPDMFVIPDVALRRPVQGFPLILSLPCAVSWWKAVA
jgi:hypothetical protein